METLSNLNDIASPGLSLPPLVVAAGLLWWLLKGRRLHTIRWPGISNRAYILCMLFSVIAVVLIFLPLQPAVRPWGGADGYFTRAVNIVTWGVYGYEQTPSAGFPPGYSFYLALFVFLFGPGRWAFFFGNILLLLGSSLVLRSVLLHLGAAARHANLLAALLVLTPNRLLSTLLPFSDTPFALMWMLSFILVLLSNKSPHRPVVTMLAGLAAGCAALMRSQGLVLLLPLCVGIAASERESHRLRRIGLLVTTALLVVTPWIIRNHALFGKLLPVSANGGLNLAIGHTPTGAWTWNRYLDTSSVFAARWAAAGAAEWNEARQDSFLFRWALENIVRDPVGALTRGFGKVAITFASDAYSYGFLGSYSNVSRLRFAEGDVSAESPPLFRAAEALFTVAYAASYMINAMWYYLLVGLAFALLWSDRRAMTPASVVTLGLLILVSCLVFVVFGFSRYKEPVGAVLLVYAGVRLFLDKLHGSSRSGGS